MLAVDELRFVREEGGALRERVVAQDDAVQESGTRVLSSLESLISTREGAERMSAAASAADVCLAALECCGEANAAHASRDFYGAIRALGEIRKVHIPAVGVASAELAGYLERCAPRCEAQIVRQVTQELNAWLTEARSLARAAGMAGIRAATARRRRLAELAKQATTC